MPRQRSLRNPPITEALFDFRAVLPESFSVESLATIIDRLSDRYPIREVQRSFEAVFAMKDKHAGLQTQQERLHGYHLKSADGLTVLQLRRDGLTLNRLKPYTSWEGLLPEALDAWNRYVELTRPEAVPRLAVRYINRFELGELGNLERTFAAAPKPLDALPGQVKEYVWRVVSEDAGGISAIVTQTLPASAGSERSVLLDIDVVKLGDFVSRLDQVPATFEVLRTIKNRIFFSSVTDEALSRHE